jgi:hypothetical protein
MKHTPGPWKIQSATRNYDNFKIEAEGWGIITNIEDNSNESEGNARLIAAAPELLEMLKITYLHIEHRDGLKYRMDLFTRDERNAIRDAILKAEEV